jgi:hypothetical protein
MQEWVKLSAILVAFRPENIAFPALMVLHYRKTQADQLQLVINVDSF